MYSQKPLTTWTHFMAQVLKRAVFSSAFTALLWPNLLAMLV